MVRILAVGVLSCVFISNAGAFDTAGKFGMGLRFWGTPIITFSNMKIGLTNTLQLEPSMGYHSWIQDYGENEYSNSLLIFSLIGDINAVRADRSNFVVKIGGAFGKTSSSYSSLYDKSSTSSTEVALLGGIGIEHFVNDNFAVNVGALSGFWLSSDDDSDASYSLTSFGNQLVDFSLVWYLR